MACLKSQGVVVVLFFVSLFFAAVSAAGDRHDRGNRNRDSTPPAAYINNCGGCHMAYPAWMLPATSWSKIMSNLDEHFGSQVSVPAEDAAVVERWLKEQAAGSGANRRGDKVARHLAGQSPLRVTDTPWFIHKHRKLPGSSNFADCVSCHTDAAQGIYCK
jgi:hypothetical protein